MHDTLPPTTYLSRTIALPPDVARQVFDTRWVLAAAPAGVLELHGPEVVGPVAGTTTLRACPGRLHVGRARRPVPIELELLAWSRRRSEVAVRFTGSYRVRPAVVEAADALLGTIVAELELRGLLALHPAHGTGTGTARRQEAVASAWL